MYSSSTLRKYIWSTRVVCVLCVLLYVTVISHVNHSPPQVAINNIDVSVQNLKKLIKSVQV